MPAIDDTLAPELTRLATQGLLRTRRCIEPLADARARVDGREAVVFCSNDYLGLARHPALRAAQAGAPAGSGASHLVTGHQPEHSALEEALAAFVGRERALLFSTGYQANLGVIAALAGRGDAVFEDRLNHASLLDGGMLSGARLQRYAHADPAALEHRLAASAAGRRLIATDGVFSMDGDTAPLAALAAVAARHDAWLMVDDAHGLGVLGPTGRGSVEAAGLGVEAVPVLVGTLGKAFGSFGAFVAGSRTLIDYLVQHARTYIYTTALPPAVAAATLAALQLIEREPWRRLRLAELRRRFRSGCTSAGIRLLPSDSPIQPVIVGEAAAAVAASEALLARGYCVTAIRPPTVPAGTSRLRVTLSALHEESQVDGLVAALAAVLPPGGAA
jgi:8-amino-7-oxononanoate synthase